MPSNYLVYEETEIKCSYIFRAKRKEKKTQKKTFYVN